MCRYLTIFIVVVGIFTLSACVNPYEQIDTCAGVEAANGQWHVIVTYSRLHQEYSAVIVDKNNRRFEQKIPAFVRRRPFFDNYWKGAYRFGSYGERSFYLFPDEKQKQHVGISHEIYDFPNEETLIDFLQSPFYGSRERTLLTPEGILVCVYTKVLPHYYSVWCGIYQLRVKNNLPSKALLRPYAHGSVKWIGAEDSEAEHLFFQW